MGGSIRIETVLQPDLWSAMVDPTQIELVILNPAINARNAMKVGGSLSVETSNVHLPVPTKLTDPPAGEYVMVAVSDTGTGIPPDILERVSEPFFTTKEVGKGLGLGLAQVLGFAQQSGGGVRIDTKVREGSSIRVYLPRSPISAEAPFLRSEPCRSLRGARSAISWSGTCAASECWRTPSKRFLGSIHRGFRRTGPA